MVCRSLSGGKHTGAFFVFPRIATLMHDFNLLEFLPRHKFPSQGNTAGKREMLLDSHAAKIHHDFLLLQVIMKFIACYIGCIGKVLLCPTKVCIPTEQEMRHKCQKLSLKIGAFKKSTVWNLRQKYACEAPFPFLCWISTFSSLRITCSSLDGE